MTTHTPGPIAELIAKLDAAVVKSERQKAESAIAGYVQGHAALLEAAPELLAALEQFVSIYPDKVRNHPDVRMAIVAADAAIAKARG